MDMDQCITELSEAVWEQTLGLPLEPLPVVPDRRGPSLSGQVEISGDWDGRVLVQCSREAARQAAHVMFETVEGTETTQDMRDALGELVNMIGGNVKSLMSESGCMLSLPHVAETDDCRLRADVSSVLARQAFDCAGEPVVVTILHPPPAN